MNKKILNIAPAILLFFAFMSAGQESFAQSSKGRPKGWPKEAQEIKYRSSADNTSQPAMFYTPQTNNPGPLLVGLHTWSDNYQQDVGGTYAKWCVKNKWVFIHPNFRGSNDKPSAMGSELAVKDIISAVDYAKKNAKVDESRIYVIGWSGGGYAALLMAGRTPEIWAGVSAWCPITDIKKWHSESINAHNNYYKDIEAAVKGNPKRDDKAAEECKARSAVTYLKNAADIPLDINGGIGDEIVPVSQSLEAFNILAAEKDRLTEKQIRYFVEKKAAPAGLESREKDPLYGGNNVIFRRQSGNARVSVFQGGHDIIIRAGLEWLSLQKKPEKTNKR